MKRKMIPLIFAALLVFLACMPGCQPQAEQSKELNLFTWEGYISSDVIDKFTKETGVKVNFLPFSGNEEMLAKLQASTNGEYDIVLASDYVVDMARRMSEAGEAPLMQKLNKSKMPNYKNIDPVFQSHYFDPSNEYVVPYVAGCPLIVYDPARVPFEIKSYADLWDESLRDSLVLIDDMRVQMGMVFKAMGHSMNVTDPAVVEASLERLTALKPNIRALLYENPHTLMISGEATAGWMFTPYVAMTLAERPDLKVVYPSEGLGYGIDSIFITGSAKNVDNAHLFLDFLLRGDISAQCSEEQLYMNCNTAAREYLTEDFYNNEALYVPTELLMDADIIEDVGDVTDTYVEVWTEFKNK